MTRRWLPALAVAMLTAHGAAQDALGPVRDLYASADYDGALGALDRIGASAGVDTTEVDRYRALCLIALGRTADAEAILERIVSTNPVFTPGDDVPPRVRTTFDAVRARVLPDVARAGYAEAKAAYDRKDFAAAVPGFERVLAVLDSLSSKDAAMGDLRTLTTGFLDLSKASLPPPAPAVPPPAESATPPGPASVREPVTEPVIIQQTLPPWNPAWLGAQGQMEFRGAVEVSIDEQGTVTSARVVDSVHPSYDPSLLEAASRWRYKPAMRGTTPVPAIKRVDVVLRPR